MAGASYSKLITLLACMALAQGSGQASSPPDRRAQVATDAAGLSSSAGAKRSLSAQLIARDVSAVISKRDSMTPGMTTIVQRLASRAALNKIEQAKRSVLESDYSDHERRSVRANRPKRRGSVKGRQLARRQPPQFKRTVDSNIQNSPSFVDGKLVKPASTNPSVDRFTDNDGVRTEDPHTDNDGIRTEDPHTDNDGIRTEDPHTDNDGIRTEDDRHTDNDGFNTEADRHTDNDGYNTEADRHTDYDGVHTDDNMGGGSNQQRPTNSNEANFPRLSGVAALLTAGALYRNM
ncbi:hypothetical protein H4R34_001890 [Dimargaris verticillata]|uniref:Uncharacterized protein n=1 Tax=Dimargaris verticillata TaxID=2761393 RepID=A0A9W8B2T1_9FUNG|nr:hypothetical protein H4R34_001890 [Dimargaris verticillata]